MATKGQAGEVTPELAERYMLSVASRFWNIPPYELENRRDAIYWINEAITFRHAENLAQEIAQDIAEKRQK